MKATLDSQSKTIALNDRFYVGFMITGYPNFTANLFFRECLPQKPCAKNWIKLSLDQSGFVISFYGVLIFSVLNYVYGIPQEAKSENTEIIKMTDFDFQTKKISLVGRARTAGQYRCEACNYLGCTGESPDKASTIHISVNDLSSRIFT